MSGSVGPIFIHDADGVPLMPLAARHARKLVQHGKALALTHQYPFSVLRLKQPVKQPTFQPILLALALHQKTVVFFVLAQAARDVLPLLSIVLDITNEEERGVHTDQPYRSGEQNIPFAVPPNIMFHEVIQRICAIAVTLTGLLPISHLLVTDNKDGWAAERQLVERLHQIVNRGDIATSQSIPLPLLHMLPSFVAEPQRYALTVATRVQPITLQQEGFTTVDHPAQTRIQQTSAFEVLSPNTHEPDIKPGVLCQTTSTSPEIGIVTAHDEFLQQTTLVSIQAISQNEIIWHTHSYPSITVQVINTNPVVFIPIASVARTRQIEPLSGG